MSFLKWYRSVALHWKIIGGMLIGVLWAITGSYLGWSQFTINWIAPFGTIFIQSLKLIAVPLILFSIIHGVASLSDISRLGKVGVKSLFAYLFTTVLAVTIGLTIVNTVKPGERIDENQRIKNRLSYEMWAQDNGEEIVDGKSFLNDPEYASFMEDAKEQYLKDQESATNDAKMQSRLGSAQNKKSQGPLGFLVDMVPANLFLSLSNNKLMLQVIVFSIFFGIVLITLPKESTKPIIDFVGSMNLVFLKMVDVVMLGAPFFVFALLAGTVAQLAGDDPGAVLDIFVGISGYSICVVVGLALVVLLIYPLAVALITRKISFLDFFRRMGPAQLLAFSSSSSAATLPVTMDCVRDKMGVSKELTSFILPVGTTINMDGTSMYQAIAAIFLAQFYGIDLTLTQQLTVVLTATMGSIGAAAVPSGGIVMLMIVLGSVGLNPAWIAVILPVDRILDMCRTVVNVSGDATVATIVAKTEKELQVPDLDNE